MSFTLVAVIVVFFHLQRKKKERAEKKAMSCFADMHSGGRVM
jgi:cbb3-type cytochrome oxidase subunit 3